MLEDFGDFKLWEKDYGITKATIGVKNGISVEEAFEAQEAGFKGQIWHGDCSIK